MLLIFCLLIFLTMVMLGLTIIARSGRSVLAEKLQRRNIVPEPAVNFFDTLWNTNEALRKESLKVAGISAAAAFMAGLLFAPQAAVVFAAVAFVLIPRLKIIMEVNCRQKLFFRQFPRAVSELAAVARTGTLLDGFRTVQREHPSPVADVFGYIAESIDAGSGAYRAVKDAAGQYGYPGLDKLADAVRAISELGGGEKAAETLSSAAEHIRFLERFRGKVDAAVGGIIYEMVLSTGIIVLYFLLTSGPWTEGWENVQKHPVIVVMGFLAIAGGWYLSLKKINAFKNKNYLC